MHIIFCTDLNAPDASDLLPEELRGASEPKVGDAWSPYESKMVSTLFNAPTHDSTYFPFHNRCSSSTPLITFPECECQTHL